MRSFARRTGPLLLIALTAALVFERLAFSPGSIIVDGERPGLDHAMAAVDRAVGNDLTRFFWPHHLRIWTAIHRDGRLPQWDPSGFGGRPFVGNPQAGLWYPPVWLVWWTQSPAMLSWLTIGHLISGAAGVWCLSRSSGLSRLAGAVAASCWIVTPYMLAQTLEGHLPHVWAANWYPWAFWAFRRWRRDDYGWRTAAPLPLFVALSLLTGHLQEGYFLGLALATWFAFDVLNRFRDEMPCGGGLGTRLRDPGTGPHLRSRSPAAPEAVARRALEDESPATPVRTRTIQTRLREGLPRDAFRMLVIGAGLFIMVVGLIAIEVAPDQQAGSWGLRSGALKLREASRYHVGILNAFQLLAPNALGGPANYFGYDNYWESVLSIGFLPLVLLTIAVLDSPRKEARGWGILVAASVLFSAGRQWGFYAVLYFILPGLDRFRVPGRALFLANLGAVILVGLGIDALRDVKIGPIARRYGWSVLGIALIVGLGAFLSERGGDDRVMAACRVSAHEPRFLVAALVAGILLGAACISPRSRQLLPASFGLLALIELVAYGHEVIKIAPVNRFVTADPIADAIAQRRPDGPFRIRVRDTFYPDLPAFSSGLEKVNMNDSFQIQHAARLYQKLYPISEPPPPDEAADPSLARKNQKVRAAILDLMNVSFVVGERPDETLAWPVVACGDWRGRPFTLQENPNPLPRAYVVPRARPAEEAPTIYDGFLANSPRDAVLMTTVPLSETPGHRQPFTPAHYTATGADRLSIDVTTGEPGLLVVADTWMPGWSATLDGRPIPVLRGNLAQCVLPIQTSGPHHVEMRYHAPGLLAGAVTTVVTLGISLLMLVMGAIPKRPTQAERPNGVLQS